MNMHIETHRRKAFELVTDALMDIDHYKQLKETSVLESAKKKLELALSEDPEYLRALYYDAMVNDLIGKAKDAIEQFEKVLKENPPFTEEVRYNLGVAYYHRYSWKYLDQAAQHFREVINNTTNDLTLNLLARSGLAQTYAMRMIQPDPTNPDKPDAKKYFDLAKEQCDFVLRSLRRLKGTDEGTLNEINWTIHNARGMSLMYYSDYFGNEKEKEKSLNEALKELKTADHYSPRNWANYCDLGSTHMRLGHWGASGSQFEKALQYLNEVITRLRPDYGFALYEIGRVYRLKGDFRQAIDYFDKSLQIPADYRDVSEKRVNLEKARAQKGSTEYP